MISETAAAAHHAVPAHPTLILCYTVMLTVVPVVPHSSEGPGAEPSHT